MTKKFSHDMTSDTANLKGLSEFVLSCLIPDITDKSILDEIVISIDEVATNIILHAYEKRKDRPVHLDIELSPEKVIFTFIHTGKVFDPVQIDQPHLSKSIDEREINGMGLYIIQQFMSKVEYVFMDGTHKENKIIMIKNLKKE